MNANKQISSLGWHRIIYYRPLLTFSGRPDAIEWEGRSRKIMIKKMVLSESTAIRSIVIRKQTHIFIENRVDTLLESLRSNVNVNVIRNSLHSLAQSSRTHACTQRTRESWHHERQTVLCCIQHTHERPTPHWDRFFCVRVCACVCVIRLFVVVKPTIISLVLHSVSPNSLAQCVLFADYKSTFICSAFRMKWELNSVNI